MRKTLLITAAALAAGIISTQAQVYSQNIVGYINLSVPVNGFNVLANQLDIGDGTNGFSQVLANGNFASDQNLVTNTVLYVWNPTGQGYGVYQYFSAADATALEIGPGAGGSASSGGWYDDTDTYQSGPIPPGSTYVLYNIHNPNVLNFTLTGSIQTQSTNTYTLVPGFTQFSLVAPVATDLILSNNFVGASDPNLITNDVLYVWNAGGQGYGVYQYFSAADATSLEIGPGAGGSASTGGFYDDTDTYQPIVPNVGQGLILFHFGHSNEYYTNSFNF